MTKPEGPAHEPQRCGVCNWPIVDNGTRVEHIGFDHTATPAPSQPAGAREWLPKQPIINYLLEMYNGRFAKDIVAAMEGYARQQTAAKEADLDRLTREGAAYGLAAIQWERRAKDLAFQMQTTRAAYNLFLEQKQAAERERDSLRELVVRVHPDTMGGVPDLFWPEGGWDKWEEDANAALKARQDGQQ